VPCAEAVEDRAFPRLKIETWGTHFRADGNPKNNRRSFGAALAQDDTAVAGKSHIERNRKAKADPSLTTPKLNYVWGPFLSG
jgi:hypothetical protein